MQRIFACRWRDLLASKQAMNPLYYKVIHIAGILLTFIGFGLLIARGLIGSDAKKVKILGSALSGLGLLILLVTGFAMIGNPAGAPLWFWLKFAIWIVIGLMTALVNRMPKLGVVWLVALLVLGVAAAYFGLLKQPF